MEGIELVDLRKRREKHFLQKNGEIIAQVYNEDIHYKNGDTYLEIDNCLIKDKGLYKNKSNDYKVYFKTDDNKDFMTLNLENHYLRFSLVNGSFNSFLVNNNTIKYQDVFENIDIEYNLLANDVKESIILKKVEALRHNIEFNIETDFELSIENNNIVCKKNDYLFTINVPYMVSSDGEYNYNVVYELIKNDECYILKLKLDENWLKNASYPVIIDPTITNSSNSNSVYDTYIYPGDTNVDRNSQDILKVGVEKVNNKNITNRALIKFELPTIGTGSQVIEATLDLIGYGYAQELYDSEIINVHQVTNDWSETGANWNNMNDKYNSRIEGYVNSYFSRILYNSTNNTATLNASHNSVDITNLVKKWYSNTPNYGILLKANDESYKSSRVPAFYSKNNTFTGTSPKPILILKYRNQNGLENYMDYVSQAFKKGTTYLNTYNGNLVSIFDLVSTLGGILPAALKLVYNTNDVVVGNDIGLGVGYKFNFYQTIENVNIDNIGYLKYLDEDGTIHYFLKKSNDIFVDEDGLNMTIEVLTSKYILLDTKGNKMEFNITDSVGYLSKIIDTNNNVIEIIYDNNMISKIIDSSGEEINIIYELNKIILVSQNENVIVNLVNSRVSSIIYKIGTIIFDYNNSLIEYITDIGGQKIKYEYYDQSPFKIRKISQYGLNNSLGQYFEVEYGFNATTLIDNKNRVLTKTFNSNGNVVSISNLKDLNNLSDAYGFLSEYGEEINNSTQYKNKLLSSQTPIKYIKNYLSDSSFENSTAGFFSENGNIIFSSQARTGFKSIKLDSNISSIKRNIAVSKGKYYTFSVYIKNNCSVDLNLGFKLSEEFNSGNWTHCSLNDTWERESVTVFYPEEAITDLELSISLRGEGEAYIDDIQLEIGEVANNYNMIDDSNFENGLNYWNQESYDRNLDSDILPSSIYSIISVNNDVNVLKINMNPKYSSAISKTYNVSGRQGDVYNISFWYKNEGLYASGMVGDPICNNVLITYDYIENSEPNGQCVFQAPSFNTNDLHWQYYSASFVALEDFNSFKICFYQDSNANSMYITNICLIKDVREVNYDYDENGNIISISGFDNKEMNYNYDCNNHLIKTTDPKGANFHYEYDNKNIDMVLNGISGTGISNKIKYDTFGNPILTKIEKTNEQYFSDGLYRIRLKGKNKYLRIINNQLVVTDDDYTHDLWNVELIDNYYRISHNIINNKYISFVNNSLVLSGYMSNNSLFELTKNDNGSYLICLKQSNVSETKKYIKYDDNYNLYFDELVDDDYHYEFYFELQDNKLFIENNVEYTLDGKFIKKTLDPLLNSLNYDVDVMSGLIRSITDEKGNITVYNYDEKDRLVSAICNNRAINYMYTNDLLTKIYNNDIEYNLVYDEFENIIKVKIGNSITLITNSYEDNNGNLISSVYGNNDEISYVYDDYDRIILVNKNDNKYKYSYDNNGNLAKIISNDELIEFTHDLSQKISKYRCNNLYNNTLLKINYIYDSNDNVINKKYEINDLKFSVENLLNADDSITQTIFGNNYVTYSYDELNRIYKKSINDNYITRYQYLSLGNRTSTIIKSIENDTDKYSYRYNCLNNITHIYHNGILENEYFYDSYNELVEENNYINNQKVKYSYDTNGNILYKRIYNLIDENMIAENTYEYNNENWCDQLTKFNNYNITYDDIGNPLTIGNTYFTWDDGRLLTSISDSENYFSYSYNVSGFRTSKMVNNTRTVYCLEGSSIIFEKTNNYVIQYIRNDIDNLIGLKYNNQNYYYIKNAQDDIIAIIDDNNLIVTKYNYDSWGRILSITDGNDNVISDATHIAYVNPFRYRSYYYDSETGLYYLNNRYYSPLLGRFLNADGIVGASKDILGYNLYIYCSNNPINKIDFNGNFSINSLLSKAKKTVGSTLNNIGKNVSNLSKKVVKGAIGVAQEIKKSFVFEFGHGPGLSGEVTAGIFSVKTGNRIDYTRKVENGKYSEGSQFKMGTNGGVGPVKIGNELEIFHEKHQPTQKQNYVDHTWWFPENSKIINCEHTEVSSYNGLSFGYDSNDYSGMENKYNSTFIGIEFGVHLGYGFHIKLGFDFKAEDVS